MDDMLLTVIMVGAGVLSIGFYVLHEAEKEIKRREHEKDKTYAN